ncbi:amino acid/amide ABC transporter ATP-binding protein 1, HAAT family [Loktanella atrilutea]|uniref:Amino acid/amide ABC transporter ATP-binding protein 1, HAAT family n=1 Tax=Loktanella atrilutea TaxID=366533 RepID=A0A1M5D5T5_LOKAT|nr:ABC transporter ATP-binding protein [Loktanella atrilutea]SHF62225.1 amino acid/amide ABC transporter ATP-binding protein 1, HAAT family [Loktanella atrilutea]
MSLLSVRNLCKTYGALEVTKDVSFDVAPGELHAIIGPNGAGKTTLIGQLSGQIAPASGAVLLDGRDVTGRSMAERVRLGLARSFQITSILPRFTVLENVAVAVQARSGSSFRFFAPVAAEAALNDDAYEVLAKAGLNHRADVRASALSHGEHRQLELAIALATQPRVLLLDEPLAGIGGQEAGAFVQRLAALKGRFATVLIEHDMDAVFALADRISVLVYGEIIATGTPDEIRNDAKVRAAYLGDEEAA